MMNKLDTRPVGRARRHVAAAVIWSAPTGILVLELALIGEVRIFTLLVSLAAVSALFTRAALARVLAALPAAADAIAHLVTASGDRWWAVLVAFDLLVISAIASSGKEVAGCPTRPTNSG